MSPLTPLDVENLQLRPAMRGFDKQEVEQFRLQVMRTLEEYIDQIGRLRMRIGEMEAEVSRYRETEDLVKNSVMLAQRTSEEIMAAAKDRAQALVAQAHNEGEAVRQQIARIQSDREQFEYEFHALLSGYLARLQQQNPRLARSENSVAQSGEAQAFAEKPDPAPGRAQADPLEQALARASAEQGQATQVLPAAMPAAAAPAAAVAWNIINPQSQEAPAQDAQSAGAAEQGVRLSGNPPFAAAARAQSLPADRPGSTFHAFSEPHWIDPEAGQPRAAAASPALGGASATSPAPVEAPKQAPAQSSLGSFLEGKRDDDIDDFTRALEQR